jgi:hypothetical protein
LNEYPPRLCDNQPRDRSPGTIPCVGSAPCSAFEFRHIHRASGAVFHAAAQGANQRGFDDVGL